MSQQHRTSPTPIVRQSDSVIRRAKAAHPAGSARVRPTLTARLTGACVARVLLAAVR